MSIKIMLANKTFWGKALLFDRCKNFLPRSAEGVRALTPNAQTNFWQMVLNRSLETRAKFPTYQITNFDSYAVRVFQQNYSSKKNSPVDASKDRKSNNMNKSGPEELMPGIQFTCDHDPKQYASESRQILGKGGDKDISCNKNDLSDPSKMRRAMSDDPCGRKSKRPSCPPPPCPPPPCPPPCPTNFLHLFAALLAGLILGFLLLWLFCSCGRSSKEEDKGESED